MGKFNEIIKYLADSYHPIGSIYITNSPTNPSSILGGTWTCIKKTFDTSTIQFSNAFTFNSTNTTNTAQRVIRLSNTMYLRLYFGPKVTLGDTDVQIGTFNYSSVGLTNWYLPQGQLAISDGLNAAVMMRWDSGSVLTSSDVITKTTATTIAASTTQLCYLTQIPFRNPSQMSDSACDQFYWKRTA